jgi:hypothetical protein
MRVVNIATETAAIADPLHDTMPLAEWHLKRREISDKIIADLNCPINFSVLKSVRYNDKTDIYILSFEEGEKSVSVKCRSDVAQFIIENLSGPGYWRIALKNGECVDACRITYN